MNSSKPLNMIPFNDCRTADDDLAREEACFKLLLEAGSEISSVTRGLGNHWISAYSETLCTRTLVSIIVVFSSLRKPDHMKVSLKSLMNLGEPFISLETTGDHNPAETTPLLLLAYYHTSPFIESVQIPDKIALLLNRGANVNSRNSRGETCLHLVCSGNSHHEHHCLCAWLASPCRFQRYLPETRDILIMMISAGADVCAMDEEDRSVSDVAIGSENLTLWTEALEYCGVDIKGVLKRRNVNSAYSTALGSQYNEPPMSVRSKISLAEYLEQRRGFRGSEYEDWKWSPLISSSEDDDSEDENQAEETSEDDNSEKGDLINDASPDEYGWNEDFAEEMGELDGVNDQETIGINGTSPTGYQNRRYRGKAKVE